MLRLLREKSHILGYILIVYGICRLGYIGYIYLHLFWDNRERKIVEANRTLIIGKFQPDYGNIALVLGYFLTISFVLFLVGFKAIKFHKKDRKQN